MKLVVLGSAADAEDPGTDASRAGPATGRSAPLQGALALTQDGQRWVLIHASPDLPQQLRATPALQPAQGVARAPIHTVILTDAHIGHVAGLLSLRDGPRLHVHATPAVFEDLSQSLPLLPALEPYCGVSWHLLPVAGDRREARFEVEELPQLRLTALALDGASPRYSSRRHDPPVGALVALHIEDAGSGRSAFVAPDIPPAGSPARRFMDRADCLLVNGAAFGARPGDPTGDAPPDWLDPTRMRRTVLFPAPRRGASDAGASPGAPGWFERSGLELAHDGMEIDL